MIDIKVPPVGESITEVTLVQWLKEDGAWVERDEVLCELESEKATFELNAEQSGILHHIAKVDEDIAVGAVACQIDETATKTGAVSDVQPVPAAAAQPQPIAESAPVPTPEPAPAPETPSANGDGEVIEIKVPTVGESITEVTLVQWLKEEGAWVERDEILCELESEKATFELNAEQAGTLHQVAQEGEDIQIGAVACTINTGAAKPANAAASVVPKASTPQPEKTVQEKAAPAPTPVVTSAPKMETPAAPVVTDVKATPVAKAIMTDKKVSPDSVKGSGSLGRIRKEDVLFTLNNPGRIPGKPMFTREETHKKMSTLRRTISKRLVEAKNSTAMLTTFNEVDMGHIMAIRTLYKKDFKEKFGYNLGFMSFFTKACCIALQEWPAVNAYLDGDSLVYHDYCDVSIAVSAPKGLVVPVIRNAESLSMAEIEEAVATLAKKARDNKLTIEEMTGGTFTITNGGVFGSLMSTPILNPPQSAILGMHKIQERPMVIEGKVEIRPMMYLALSYDHRVIDGRESVGFLVRVKELLENPEQLLIGKDPIKTLLEL